MGPERFVAPTAAEALKLVRKSMGDEAMVLSTRQTPDGVEITAITSEALDQLSALLPEVPPRAQQAQHFPKTPMAHLAGEV
ncbi:MAG: hypothetical protein RL132_1103 [Pseudomonadota bacterium]